jgi:hypothetical protein
MNRAEMHAFFIERLSKTRLHAMGIGSYEIGQSLASVVYAGGDDQEAARRADIASVILAAFSDHIHERLNSQ